MGLREVTGRRFDELGLTAKSSARVPSSDATWRVEARQPYGARAADASIVVTACTGSPAESATARGGCGQAV
jgi:hypothetical protein